MSIPLFWGPDHSTKTPIWAGMGGPSGGRIPLEMEQNDWSPKLMVVIHPENLTAGSGHLKITQHEKENRLNHPPLGGGNSNIYYFHLYLGRWSNLTIIFFKCVGSNHQPDLHFLGFKMWRFHGKRHVRGVFQVLANAAPSASTAGGGAGRPWWCIETATPVHWHSWLEYPPGKLTWLAGTPTMNEDVFPIEKWGFSNVMLVFRGVSPCSIGKYVFTPGPAIPASYVC